MAARRSQFLLFGGEEEVVEPVESPPSVPKSSTDEWEYPPDAFPPDPWDALVSTALREFEAAVGSPAELRRALCRYFKRGQAASFEYEELVDRLFVSNDLLGVAGSEAEVARIAEEVLPTLTSREIATTSLD